MGYGTLCNLQNNPNEWAAEQGNPRYILDLLPNVITKYEDDGNCGEFAAIRVLMPEELQTG